MHQEGFDTRQLMGLLAAGVGLGMAMKLTKRLYSGPEAEDEGDASEKRLEMLAELAASGELRLEDLTEEEAESFRVALKSGDLGRALGAWQPWWQKVAAVDLLSLDEDDAPGLEGDESLHQDPPRHLCCSADGSRQAHPSVVFTVLEALFAYVHTLRAFNGDWRWDPLQAAAHMFHLGKGIWAHQVHESATSTLQALWQLASKLPGGGFGASFDRHCVGDVATILSRGVGSCARALREATDLATAAADAAEEGQVRGAARLRRGVKKLDFLTSFAWHHPEALGADLAAQVQALEEVLQGYGQRLEDVSKRHSARTAGIALPERLGRASGANGLALGATALDDFVAPEEVPVNSPVSFAARLHNQSSMPQSCTRVVPTDAVENASVASECLAWCRDSLGPGSGLPFAFSPWHWRHMKEAGEAVETSFKTCWKVETAAWALGWCPSNWQMYLAAVLYGSVSSIAFLCFQWKNWDEESESDESEESEAEDSESQRRLRHRPDYVAPDDEGFEAGSPFAASRRHKPPFCCIGINSDHEGAKCQLRLSCFFMLFEPALDILSILMFLRRGQPIYAAVVGTSVAISCALEHDLFQIRGAAAMAASLRRGFATPLLYEHQVLEIVESSGSTIVQCYAALRMDLTAGASLSTVCTLIASAGCSLLLSLPQAVRAASVLGGVYLDDYYEQEKRKAGVQALWRYLPSALCMSVAELALILGRHNDGQFASPWSLILQMPSWELFLSALFLLGGLVLGVFACCLICGFMCFVSNFPYGA
ncbi:Znhit2 [Symbiodinium sp. KB8]|nr:Znhit2 [Symbiodinium sp. KB8]